MILDIRDEISDISLVNGFSLKELYLCPRACPERTKNDASKRSKIETRIRGEAGR